MNKQEILEMLQLRQEELDNEGKDERLTTNLLKLLGMTTTIAGSITLAAGISPLAIFAVPGVAFYLMAASSEAKRTGALRPLPFVDASLTGLMAQADASTRGMVEEEPMTDYNYLTPLEKAEYTLAMMGGPQVAGILSNLPPEQRMTAWKHAVRRFADSCGRFIGQSPYQLERALGGNRNHFADLAALAFDPTAPTSTVGTVGAHTKLNAIEASASSDSDVVPMPPIGDIVDLPQTIAPDASDLGDIFAQTEPSLKTNDDGTFNLAHALATTPLDECKSLLVMGEPGVGKGLFIQTWKDALLAQYPNAVLYAVNPKPDSRESHRWQGFKSVLDVTDSDSASRALDALEKIEQALKLRLSQPSDVPFCLVLDEFNTLSDLWASEQREKATKLIKRIARQGRSLRCRLLLALHSPNADELGMSASDRACFTSVALGFKNNQSVLRIAAGNQFLFPGLPSKVTTEVQSHKGRPYGVALCSEYDRVIRLPDLAAASVRPYLEDCLSVEIEEPEITTAATHGDSPKIDLDAVIDLIEILTPHEGATLKARDFYRNSDAKKLGVTAFNAEQILQEVAQEISGFEYCEEPCNSGKTSKYLKRIS